MNRLPTSSADGLRTTYPAAVSPSILLIAAMLISTQPALAASEAIAKGNSAIENARENATENAIEEIVVWGDTDGASPSDSPNPVSVLEPADLQSINVTTTEDVLKYEPSLVIRRRFIGDSNGVIGMRGSNMFQTSRTMVFADGVPLHYLLQSRWNGAPRWTMVSASEIAKVETLYGPFSAEFGGNAVGGVILIETAIPQRREFHVDSSFFTQQFDDYGFDDSVSGYKTFVSYGDQFGDTSLYLSYNHLDNDSQPQTFLTGAAGFGSATPVSGAIPGVDERSQPRLYYGDTGVVEARTDNYKLKIGQDFSNWSALLNVAYEARNTDTTAPNSYVTATDGSALWSGTVAQEGVVFSIPASSLNVSQQNRDSLSVGLRVRADLAPRVSMEGNLSLFDILEDRTRSSARNPADPSYGTAGQVAAFDNTGWRTADLKLSVADLLVSGLDLTTGARYESYELNLDIFNSDDWRGESRDLLTASSGGKTNVTALFAQAAWSINERWDVTLGGRFEWFESDGGYYADDDPGTPATDIASVPGTHQSRFSPKLSVGWHLSDAWLLRYSFGKAYRFPIVEELFSQYQAYNAVSIANPELRPEDVTAHNLMIDRTLGRGYVRINLFHEQVDDVIESQSTSLPGGLSIRTFVPMDVVRTQGIELIVNQPELLFDNLDMRFNLTWTDSTIVRNDADPSIEGNRYPRMPEWRGNLLVTYHLSPSFDIGGSIQYASDSFGRNDNADTARQVYGAQDPYTFLGIRSNWHLTDHFGLSVGVDNVTNATAFVAHPWPGRTWYGSFSYDL